MSNNLGNERKVVRVDLEDPTFVKTTRTGPAPKKFVPVLSTDPLYPRGQLLWFDKPKADGSSEVLVGASAVVAGQDAPTALGVVAEAFTDTRAITADAPVRGRRRPRVNSRRLAVPVTFNGVDIALGDKPHTGFAPGDFVFMCVVDEAVGDLKTKLVRADEPNRVALSGKPMRVYLGVAHTAAEPGTHHVELYVNPF
jgi:hypothetical protein